MLVKISMRQEQQPGRVMVFIDGMNVANPAFEVTPHKYITAIITERGIIKEPYGEETKEIVRG